VKSKKKIFGLSMLVLLSACAKDVKENNRPDWIDKPQGYFVGRCATNDGELKKVGSLQLKTFKSVNCRLPTFVIS